MADIWVTVPTAGRESLLPAIDGTGVPRERIVIVATAPDVAIPDGCLSLTDLGPVNIHRWWNAGIDAAVARGARYVAVINDDILVDENTLPTLLAQMQEHETTIASPGAPRVVRNGEKSMPMTILGSCWLLDTSHGLRPDERYRWWYGDNDLDWRARRDHRGIVTAPCYFHHLTPNQLTAHNPALLELTELDNRRWARS